MTVNQHAWQKELSKVECSHYLYISAFLTCQTVYNKLHLHQLTDSPLGGYHRWGMWEEEAAMRWSGRGGRSARLESESTSSGSALQGLWGPLYYKAAKGFEHQRAGTAEMNQRTLTRRHTPRSEQPAVGIPQLRVSCDKWPKHPMRLGCPTDDVSQGKEGIPQMKNR